MTADGKTAAEVGAETPGQLTKWAEALRIKQAEEAAKRAAEMAEVRPQTRLLSLTFPCFILKPRDERAPHPWLAQLSTEHTLSISGAEERRGGGR